MRGCSPDEKSQPVIGLCWCDFKNFRAYNVFHHERIGAQPARGHARRLLDDRPGALQIPLREVKQRVGNRMCLMGNVNPLEIAVRGGGHSVGRGARRAVRWV
jgi:uroporphyrinogen-III decarboxylase